MIELQKLKELCEAKVAKGCLVANANTCECKGAVQVSAPLHQS